MKNKNLKKSKEKLTEQYTIFSVVCSACGEPLKQHELPSELNKIDKDTIECIPCEIKYRDSADIDNFGA